MTRAEIEKITNDFLIEEIEVESDAICDDASLKDDLEIDSLDFVDIVVIVEKKFGFKIKPEEMANVKILKEFYDYIDHKLNS